MNFRYLALLLIISGMLACEADPKGNGEQMADTPRVEFKQTDNTARIAIRAEPPGLNPVLSTQSVARYVHENIFQTINDQDPETYEQVPLLASLADIGKEENGQVSYAYEIDADATWPNGLPVTAQDVIFSLKIVLNPLVASGAYRPYYAMVSSVVTSPNNEKRFKIMTKRPYMLAEQAIGSLVIYPEYAYDPDQLLRSIALTDFTNENRVAALAENSEALKTFSEQFNDPEIGHSPDKIVGSGPYQLVSWEEGVSLRLERRDNYWANDRDESWLAAEPDALVFSIISDASTIGNALRDELVDVVVDMGIDQFKEFRTEEYLQERYDFSTVNSFKYFGLLMNQNNPLLKEVKTRRALAHLVDVDAMIEQLFDGGLARRVVGPVLPGKSYYNDALEPIPYNPERAATLLSEAGWEDADGDGILDMEIDGERQPLSFQFLVFPSATSEAIGTLVSEWAAEVGVDIEVVVQDFRALYGELNKGNFAMAILGQGFDPSPDEFTQVWASTSVPPNGTNRGGFSSAEADQLIKKIAITIDPEQRDPLYRRFQEIVYENQPMIFLVSPVDRVVVSRRFEFEPNSISPNVYFNDLKQADWNKK
ncbi:ABC transporter substrate-binding protein [Lewinella sp. W8]|uniref:ABC transporter substrate-binding protein n=1 Tax=Lewinella sp. W8 TaxID=2528208 RepID=UPI001067C47D|nr:ABC transporter substrate-binding protein [Lewinella sp. W8]MTB52985.1 hypothetical protein [Lewinella sp. W8]